MRFSLFYAALDAAPEAIQVFFRDDDAGWADDRLMSLLDVFEEQRAPVDLAVIPQAITRDLALELCVRRARAREQLGLHQHGFSHANHETEGRKCEFGPTRSAQQQLRDVSAGQSRLRALLGNIDQIFTPPWNRCSQSTVEAIRSVGLSVLSRDATAAALDLGAIRACPVHVDWCKWTNTPAPDWALLDRQLASAVFQSNDDATLGIMLHHAVMAEADWQALGELLGFLRSHSRVRLKLMRDLVDLPRETGASRAAA